MILRGHHQDFKNGVEVFDEFAKLINGLGRVLWSNMTDITRRSYLWRMERNTCRLRPLARHIVFELPSEATGLLLETPGDDDGAWEVVSDNGSVRDMRPARHLLVAGEGNRQIMLKRNVSGQPALRGAQFTHTAPRFILRRLLTEARDRLLIS
jgi:hypothetical protein